MADARGSALLFPVSRVRRIMKADPDVGGIQADAVLAVSAAAEIFADTLTRRAARPCDADRRRTITYRDVASTVADDARFAFLAELIPRALPPAEAAEVRARVLAERAPPAGVVLVADDPDADPADDAAVGSNQASRAPSPVEGVSASQPMRDTDEDASDA